MKMFSTNVHLTNMGEDHLHHLSLSRKSDGIYDAAGKILDFSDVKFVLTGGSSERLRNVAEAVNDRVYEKKFPIENLCANDRFVMYKVGQHGMGIPSMSIMLHEIIKLLQYSECKDPIIFRIGTSGGIGCPTGSVVVSTKALTGLLKPNFQIAVLGAAREIPAAFNQSFINQFLEFGHSKNYPFDIITGTTVGTDDFYEAQGRLDGAFCDYSAEDRQNFLMKVWKEHGVRNFEMEAPAFAAYTKRAGIKSAIVCCTLLDRLQGDQPKLSHAEMLEVSQRPITVVIDYILEILKPK